MNADSYGDALDCTLKEITKLHKTIAAQAADIRTLEIEFGDVRDSFLLYKEKTQAQATVIERLREALTACVCAMQDHQAGIGITEIFDRSEELGRKALAIPTNSTQILAEVRRAERERVEKMILDELFDSTLRRNLITKIRAMEDEWWNGLNATGVMDQVESRICTG